MNYDSLLQIISQTSIDATGFADDLLAGKEENDPEQLVVELQTTMNKVVEWGNSCGLKFNPNKSNAVLFHRKQKKQSHTYTSTIKTPHTSQAPSTEA